ncbi:MAG: hydrogenase [Acetobacteraceae bacterium]|nr:hydrogenase [Acetobacteraceae bacterium]
MRQLFLPMRIWDLPTRLFHWVLVALVLTSWISAKLNVMPLHVLSGLSIMTLLIFRLIWGIIGSDTARFTHFLKSPAAAIRHLLALTRREPDTEVGHNAAGGWMVLGLLGILSVQVGSGLCANDDVMTEGPLALIVGKDLSDWLTHIHHLNFVLIEIAVVLHVLAIVTYRVLKGHNLLLPMITGRKRLPGATAAPRMMHPMLGLAVFVLSAAVVVLFVRSVS